MGLYPLLLFKRIEVIMATRASKKSSLENGVFDLGALNLGDSFVTAGDYTYATVDDFIPTGILSLDHILEGGIPMGRVIEVFSPENVGKSTFVIQVGHMANTMGIPVFYFDVEGTASSEHLEELGADMRSTVMFQPRKKDDLSALSIENIASQMESAMLKLQEAGLAGVFVWDSIGQSMSKRTVNGDYDDQQPGREAKAISAALYKLTPLATQTGSSLILINQLRDKIGAMAFGDTTDTPGGRVLKHSATYRIKLDKTGAKKLAGEEFGHKTQFKLVKSKLGQPRRKAPGVWLFSNFGFNEYVALLMDGEENNIIRKKSGGSKGSYYSLPNQETGEEIQVYEKDLPELIESGEIESYMPSWKWLANELSKVYFPKGHPALNNKNYSISKNEMLSGIQRPEQTVKTEVKKDNVEE